MALITCDQWARLRFAHPTILSEIAGASPAAIAKLVQPCSLERRGCGLLGPGESMRRRDFIGALGGVAAAWPVMARARPSAGRISRIGFVGVVDNPIISPGYPAFVDELKKSGFSEGQNLAIEAVRDIRDT